MGKMLVRSAFENDFLEISNKSVEWGDTVVEREGIYHIMTLYFRDTCFVAEDRGKVIGYLLGFRSQVVPEHAIMHLIQVEPKLRGVGVGRRLFNMFEAEVRSRGCKKIYTTLRPENSLGAKFHEGMGFSIVKEGHTVDVSGVPALKDFNGPGKHIVLWKKDI
jgi:GNAT superfamily N-acetyltransferase